MTRRRCPFRRTCGARRWTSAPGHARQRRLLEYADLGLERVIVQGFAAVQDADYLESLIDDCGAVGLLVPPP